MSPLLSGYCLPGSCVWCLSPGAPPPVIEIPSSRRVARVCFPGTRSAYQVTKVLPSRQQGVVRVSGGFTTGYQDAVFQTDGASVLFVHAFRLTGYRGTAFQAAVCGACLRGLHPRLSRYRLPDGWCGCAFWARVPHTKLQRYCLPGSCVWCLRPGASPPVTEMPSSRREVVCQHPGFGTSVC